MTRYYLVILIVNVLVPAVLFYKLKGAGISLKVLFAITGVSMLVGFIFPLLVSSINLYAVLVVNLVIISTGAYIILQIDHDTGKEKPVPAVVELDVEDETVRLYEVEEVAQEAVATIDTADMKMQGEEIMCEEDVCLEDNTDLRDSYIMRGFDAKFQGKADLAVKYFSSALELEPPQDVYTMLLLDIFAMLRDTGQYQQAKELFVNIKEQVMLNLPGEIQKEIKAGIKQMEILQEMLTKANSPNLPYSMVPALIKMSVEEKIDQWKQDNF
jgi:tetratricopeptide (TPR) repeat protein